MQNQSVVNITSGEIYDRVKFRNVVEKHFLFKIGMGAKKW